MSWYISKTLPSLLCIRFYYDFLCLRTKIDWLMPNLLQTDKIVEGIAKIYHDGDKSKNLKKHRWPIMNSRPRASSGLSKVMYRKSNEEARLSFLV